MLVSILIFATVLSVSWFLWKNWKYYIGTENRHRFFAEYFKDFPVFHNAKTLPEKKKLFEPLHDLGENVRILEIGAGSGANLEFYPKDTILTVVDPNPFFKPHLDERLSKYPGIKLENYIVSGAENMKKIPDHSVDAVISTLVLCSVTEIQTIYKEIQRVLVPGGKFFFMEHVVDDKFSLLKLVQVIGSNLGFFQFLFDGCRNDRDIETELHKGGFAQITAKRFRLDLSDGIPLALWGVYTIVPHLYGVATTRK